jgi:hypothetical protein
MPGEHSPADESPEVQRLRNIIHGIDTETISHGQLQARQMEINYGYLGPGPVLVGCPACGAAVYDQISHTAWHRRQLEGKMI